MTFCPFCHKPIDPTLEAQGGHCPSCSIELPGVETPTDPGERPPPAVYRARVASYHEWLRWRGPFAFGAITLALCSGALMALLDFGQRYQEAGQLRAAVERSVVSFQEEVAAMSRHVDFPLPQEVAVALGLEAPEAAEADSDEDRTAPAPATNTEAPTQPTAPSARTLAHQKVSVPQGAPSEPVDVAKPPELANPFDALSNAGRDLRSLRQRILDNADDINRMVGRVMSVGQSQLRQCYESRLKTDDTVRGRWLVEFEIETNGRPDDVRVVALDSSDNEIESCIARNVSGWGFQPIAEPLAVEKVFRFGSTM